MILIVLYKENFEHFIFMKILMPIHIFLYLLKPSLIQFKLPIQLYQAIHKFKLNLIHKPKIVSNYFH
jgi:hypothetical protein